MNQPKTVWCYRYWKCTEAYILESVLPKGCLKETNRSIYLEACLVQPARWDILNERAYFYELTKARMGSLGSWRMVSLHSRPWIIYNKCWKGKKQRSKISDWYLHEGTLNLGRKKNHKNLPSPSPEATWLMSWKASGRTISFKGPTQFTAWFWPNDLRAPQLSDGDNQAHHPLSPTFGGEWGVRQAKHTINK